MALSKRTYVGGTTKITAANLNDIQDSIIALEGKGITKEEVVDALEYTPAKASDIPTTDISANTAARHSHSNKDVLDNITEIASLSSGAITGDSSALITKEILDATSDLIMEEIPSVPTSEIQANTNARHSHSNKTILDSIMGLTEVDGNGNISGNHGAVVTMEAMNVAGAKFQKMIPTSLKNPNALTFTGAATGTYDGSSALTVNIPSSSGSTGATGNELQYKGEWISTGNYQANDVVDDGVGRLYLYTGSGNGDPPDLDEENAKPFIKQSWSIGSEEYGYPTAATIYSTFKYLLNTTTDDTGKFLRVNSAGKPVWESVPSGEGVNF